MSRNLDKAKEEAVNKDNVKGKEAGVNGGYKDQNKSKDYAKGNTKDSVSRGAGKYRGNDVNAVRLSDATAINFDMPISDMVGYLSTASGGATFGLIKEHSIFIARYIPTLGSDTAANLASAKMAGEARRELKVIQNYAPGDLFCYSLAVQSLFECIEYVKRVVRLANTYVTHNFLYPKFALNALGFNLDEVIANSANYREVINKAIVAAQNCAIPKLFDAANLRIRLNSQIYMDDMTRKAQTILFRPDGFWKWDLTSGTSTQPSDMLWVANNMNDLTTVENMLTSLLEPLITDQDAMYIHGDIMKVWGESAFVIPAEPITYDQVQEFTYDPLILYMLHNATIHYGFYSNNTAPTIKWVIPAGSQSPYLTQSVHVRSWKGISEVDVLDSPIENPSAADIANFCRWKSWTKGVGMTKSAYDTDAEIMSSGIFAMPLEIITGLWACTFDIATSTRTNEYVTTHFGSGNTAAVGAFDALDVLAVHPIGYDLDDETQSGVTILATKKLRGDRSWYTLVDMSYVGRINTIVTELNYDL